MIQEVEFTSHYGYSVNMKNICLIKKKAAPKLKAKIFELNEAD